MYVSGKVDIFNRAARKNLITFEGRCEGSKGTGHGDVISGTESHKSKSKSGISLPPSRTSREGTWLELSADGEGTR